MRIGVPREIKRLENRVALTPDGAGEFTAAGHTVYVEKGAGAGAGFSDQAYAAAGAQILSEHAAIYEQAELIYKVKEPLTEEYDLLREGQILFAFLHLAANRELTLALLEKQVTAIAFETVQLSDGHLPLLEPMSEVAGRLAVQEGAKYLEKTIGGRGVLLGGIPGVARGRVVVVGGGTVGLNATRMAVGLGADVTLLDISKPRLQYYDNLFQGRVETLYSTPANLMRVLSTADVAVGAVLIPGAAAPKLITAEMVRNMRPGSVIVDVAVDQGGCCVNTRPTYHDQPTFIVDEIIHYCVANMPGAVPLTSTLGLSGATLPYALKLADSGLKACVNDAALFKGVNTYRGQLHHLGVAESLKLDWSPLKSATL